jgi:hypothetical protein
MTSRRTLDVWRSRPPDVACYLAAMAEQQPRERQLRGAAKDGSLLPDDVGA